MLESGRVIEVMALTDQIVAVKRTILATTFATKKTTDGDDVLAALLPRTSDAIIVHDSDLAIHKIRWGLVDFKLHGISLGPTGVNMINVVGANVRECYMVIEGRARDVPCLQLFVPSSKGRSCLYYSGNYHESSKTSCYSVLGMWYWELKHRCALTIQRAYRRAISDPSFTMCHRRLLREVSELMAP
jgi:hypothetical protein